MSNEPGKLVPGEPPIITDRELIQRTLDGSSDAFSELVRIHRPALLSAAMRMLRNLQDSEDLLQHVFIEAYRHLGDFRQDSKLSTWLYSITLNRARNFLRQRRRHMESSLEDQSSDSDDKVARQYADPQPSFISELERSAESAQVRKAVDKLPPHYRELVVDHYLKAMPLQAIAEKTGRPLNTVKVYLLRARHELAKIMKDRP